MQKWKATLAEGLAKIPGPSGERYASVLQQGKIEVELYAPRGSDPQQPHTRDEVYFVMQGRGQFINGEEREPFGPGDVLFVPAGIPHRFEDFSDDLVVWALFCSA